MMVCRGGGGREGLAEALILMKLSAGRPQDIADISSLLEAGADIDNVIKYLRKMAPELVDKFAEIIQ